MTEIATFAGGCFWCTEAIFKMLKGVESVVPGYSGGKLPNPSYENIGDHAEAVQIKFDPEKISYETLLEVFFHTHNPTSLNRQGADVGPQYRSAIFFHSEDQRMKAERAITSVQSDFDEQVVTQLEPFDTFTEAEDYHKNYFETHSDAPYCKVVIDPKVKKVLDEYAHLVK